MKHKVGWAIIAVLVLSGQIQAQNASIYHKSLKQRQQAAKAAKAKSQGGAFAIAPFDRSKPLNPELEKASLIAVTTPPPNEFKVHDIISVIVREQTEYESDSKMQSKKRFSFETKLDSFIRTLNGNLAAASFTDGKPNIAFEVDNQLKNKGDIERNDELTFRMAVEVVDIKPNGQLVLSGKQQIVVDEEVQSFTLTGICRSEDVTADNTILSTQVFNQMIDIQHHGAVRDASKRGWLIRLFERGNPF